MIGFSTVLDTTLISEDFVSTTVSEDFVSTTVSEVSTEVTTVNVVVGVDNSFWSPLLVNPSVTLTLILLGLNLVCHGKLKNFEEVFLTFH